MPRHKVLHILLAVAAGLALAAASCALRPSSFHGEAIRPAAAAPQIEMTDQNGRAFDLGSMRGQIVLVFFGFTNCVDECPLTLAQLKQARELLGNDAGAVKVVLVTTDPVRDTPAILQEYLARFDPAFIGITGSPEVISKIWDDYGVTVMDGGETHSSYTFVIDQDGNLRLRFDPEMAPVDVASDLKTLLSPQ